MYANHVAKSINTQGWLKWFSLPPGHKKEKKKKKRQTEVESENSLQQRNSIKNHRIDDDKKIIHTLGMTANLLYLFYFELVVSSSI